VTAALADTHALLWWLADDARLSDRARKLIARGEVPVQFSAASVWEAEIKAAAGKLTLPDDLVEALEADGFLELPVIARHAQEAARLAPLHRDPFDRMLVAQARVEGLTVITADPKIAAYGAQVLW
jgi:PIN domain nuclease of toxin-antitoxin system